MSFLSLHKAVTYVIAGAGLWALTLGFELDPLRAGLLAVGFAASFFVEGRILDRPGWSRGWTAAVLVAFALQAGRAFLGAPVLEVGVEYAAFLQISRLFNRRGARDHQQIAVLAFLHLVAATVLTTDVRYAAVFFAFVVVTPWMLALSHLRREIEDHYPRPAGGVDGDGPTPDVRRVLRSRRLVGAPFLVGTALLALPIFLSTALLFLAFPRVGLGMISFGGQGGRSVTGFGREVTLGEFGLVRDDPTVVLRVYAPGPDVRAPGYLRPPFRLRGTSFDRYDGRRWSRSGSDHEEIPRMFEYYPIARWPRARGDATVRILLDQLDEPVVFLPDGTVGISVPPRQRQGVEAPRRILRGPGLDVRYADADDVGLAYEAHVADPTNLPIGGTVELTPNERAQHLALPPLPPEKLDAFRRLSERLGGAGDRERVARVVDHLREGPYRYTRRIPPLPEGADPLSHFLWTSRAGHCEYFATAAAILLRAGGVPTRHVTGFLGGDYNRYGGFWSVSQGDAHAWVEAWIDGFGWVTVEATPSAATAGVVRDGLVDRARALADALRARWIDYVVTYDLQSQIDAVVDAYEWLGRFRSGRVGRSAPAGPGAPAADASPAGRATPGWGWALGLGGLLVAWLVGRAVWRARRGARPDVPADVRPVLALFQELEALLARRGHPRPPSRTPRAHAASLARAGVPGAQTVCEITEAYLEARFADRSPPEERLTALARDLRSLRSTLAETHAQGTQRDRRRSTPTPRPGTTRGGGAHPP